MITDLWSADRAVLVEIVHQIEVEGDDFADCEAAIEKAGVDPAAGIRSVERLVRNGLLGGSSVADGSWAVDRVTERGLRESGAWPTADQLAERVVAALDEAAEHESEPEKQGRFRTAASVLGGAGRDVLVDVLAAVAVKTTGLG